MARLGRHEIAVEHGADLADEWPHRSGTVIRVWLTVTRPSAASRYSAFKDFAATVLARETGPADPVGDYFQGGPFCSDEFTGDLARLKARG